MSITSVTNSSNSAPAFTEGALPAPWFEEKSILARREVWERVSRVEVLNYWGMDARMGGLDAAETAWSKNVRAGRRQAGKVGG